MYEDLANGSEHGLTVCEVCIQFFDPSLTGVCGLGSVT